MNRIEKNKTQTDQAWNKLHNRLETDGLLPTVTERRFATRPTAWIGIAAIAAIISLCVYLPTVLRTDRHLSGGELLVKANKEESILVTTLEDGSVVYLSEQTSLEYPKHFSKKRREVSLKGNALFDIAGNRARPFFIETGKVRIEVIGTAFHVRNSGNSPFELAVQRGEVKVTQKQNGQEIHVKAGETATLLGDEWQLTVTENSEQFTRYMQNMRFKDEQLDHILHAINLRQTEIYLQSSPELGKHVLTVSFSEDSPEKMAELIGLALNLKCTRNQNIITLSE